MNTFRIKERLEKFRRMFYMIYTWSHIEMQESKEGIISDVTEKIVPGTPKMKIFENFQNHQEWCETSSEHEIKLKYMILDELWWRKQLKTKEFKNWHSKCAFSQKRVPEAVRILILIFILFLLFKWCEALFLISALLWRWWKINPPT